MSHSHSFYSCLQKMATVHKKIFKNIQNRMNNKLKLKLSTCCLSGVSTNEWLTFHFNHRGQIEINEGQHWGASWEISCRQHTQKYKKIIRNLNY